MSSRSAADDDSRLASWLAERGLAATDLAPLVGDVSSRRYWRALLADGRSAILARYPREIAGECERYLGSTRLLAAVGVRVPEILAADCPRGLMLVEDVGRETLFERRAHSWRELGPRFEAAAELVERIAELPAAEVAELNPPLDESLLASELRQTRELFLSPRGLTGDAATAEKLAALFASVCRRLGAERPTPCHRDFMARNLVPVEPAPAVAVLDHQGLRLGPPFYDLASLLNDSLFPPPSAERRLLDRFVGHDTAARERFHRAAAQRTLKAVGTYAAFARRGFDRHLALVPPTLGRALGHLRRLPEASALAPRLERLWGEHVEPYLLD